ncbi:MAG: ABC transporter permease [Phycisphaerales bacterium]|nr:ABC transporter permease [Phycisphaerales bacterium]
MRFHPINIVRRPFRWAVSAASRNAQNVATAAVQIWANKGRSVLTTLGIVIAVTSIITVISVVQGFGNYMTNMVRGYGTSFIVVHPWYEGERHGHGMREPTLDIHDITAVRGECPDVRRITPFVFTHNAVVSYGREKAEEIPIRGVAEEYQLIRNFPADAGRFFGPVDVDNAEPVAVLGRTLLTLLECDESIIGDYIYIDDTRFLVVGLLAEKGSFGDGDQDKTIMIPYTRSIRMYPDRTRSMSFLAEATDEDHIDAAYAQIQRTLRQRHGLTVEQPDDFYIERQDQSLQSFEEIRNISSGILGGIVSISLLVGGIGIMNMMLVSVTERTAEIGLRKSIGARRRDILLQFLTEAVVLCTFGGLIGVALGYGLSKLASMHPSMVPAEVPWWAVAAALGCSAGTGIVFGVIPAFKAAILNPIDALRHE